MSKISDIIINLIEGRLEDRIQRCNRATTVIQETVDTLVHELYTNSSQEYRCSHCALTKEQCCKAYKVAEQCKVGMRDFIFLHTGVIDKDPVEEINTIANQLGIKY